MLLAQSRANELTEFKAPTQYLLIFLTIIDYFSIFAAGTPFSANELFQVHIKHLQFLLGK